MVENYTPEQIQEWKEKADKWDDLEKEVAKYYEGPNGEQPEKDGDLCDIGEKAATAFGWL